MVDEVYKVTAYITRHKAGSHQLLVFREQGDEHSTGIQVPGGTVEKGEGLLDALGREVYEESGLVPFNIKQLGSYSYHSVNLDRKVKRYYFQMNAVCSDEFTHVVNSEDDDNGWIYNYYWHDLNDNLQLSGYLAVRPPPQCLEKSKKHRWGITPMKITIFSSLLVKLSFMFGSHENNHIFIIIGEA